MFTDMFENDKAQTRDMPIVRVDLHNHDEIRQLTRAHLRMLDG